MELPGINNINPQSQKDGINDKKTFLHRYHEYKDLIKELVKNKESKSFYKFSDGLIIKLKEI